MRVLFTHQLKYKSIAMHTIEIRQAAKNIFDVLINDISYRIHRSFAFDSAVRRANEIKKAFSQMGERSIIKGAHHVA
jgi:ATP-dependent RNA circularization protein (DNA/RNA ligase family)